MPDGVGGLLFEGTRIVFGGRKEAFDEKRREKETEAEARKKS